MIFPSCGKKITPIFWKEVEIEIDNNKYTMKILGKKISENFHRVLIYFIFLSLGGWKLKFLLLFCLSCLASVVIISTPFAQLLFEDSCQPDIDEYVSHHREGK